MASAAKQSMPARSGRAAAAAGLLPSQASTCRNVAAGARWLAVAAGDIHRREAVRRSCWPPIVEQCGRVLWTKGIGAS